MAFSLRSTAYILIRVSKSKPTTIVPDQHRFSLFIYWPPQGKLLHATRTCTTGPAGGVATKRERPILVAYLDLAPGKGEVLSLLFQEGLAKSNTIPKHEHNKKCEDKCN